MTQFNVDFETLDWQSRRPGMRFKLYGDSTRQLRLVEFLTSDLAPELCEASHIGLVLAGRLDIEIGGTVVSFKQGDGVFIPAGAASAHRATAITPGTRVLFVEDVQTA